MSREILSRIVELNKEYLEANPSRRLEIEKEIVSLAPKDLFPSDNKLKELEDTLKDLKSEIVKGVRQDSFEEYHSQLRKLEDSIENYANEIEANIPLEHRDLIKKVLEVKFDKTRKS